jgi:CDP-diacylglycerol--glycerol-3-phosphate 3-phosphatidyltransferase
MTVANKLTLFRLALVPGFMVFMFFDHFWTRVASLVIFIVASITDWYDGRIARRTGTVTVIGTFLDPLVDKMLIAAALVGFVELPELHIRAWMVVLIISREFLITGLRSLAASRGLVMAAEGAGKYKMVSQVTGIILILVILVLNAGFERWPAMAPNAIGGWSLSFLNTLERAPFWLVFWATIMTIVSGVLYLRKYSGLLKDEFAMLNSLRAK